MALRLSGYQKQRFPGCGETTPVTGEPYAYVEPEPSLVADPVVQYMNRKQLEKAIERTKKQMMEAAKKLDFIEAAQFRDELVKLEDLLVTKKD